MQFEMLPHQGQDVKYRRLLWNRLNYGHIAHPNSLKHYYRQVQDRRELAQLITLHK